MNISKLDIAPSFEHCDAENLRQTSQLQIGFETAVVRDGTLCAASEGLVIDGDVDHVTLAETKEERQISPHMAVVQDAQGRDWFRHQAGPWTILERPNHARTRHDVPDFDWAMVEERARGSIWKLSYALCEAAFRSLGAARIMVYKFDETWCGEVIAERLEGDLAPFLGLHYPPTDIPKEARALFLECGSRHIFNLVHSGKPLLGEAAAEVDLSRAISRSVSPYHIAYLRNMGSASTASVALTADGKLWGLLSLHFDEARVPSNREIEVLQDVAGRAGDLLQRTLAAEAEEIEKRADRLLTALSKDLGDHNDPFLSLVLSSHASHRLMGAQGMSLVVSDEIVNVGQVPQVAIIRSLTARHSDLPLNTPHFAEQMSDLDVAGADLREIAGYSITRLSEKPEAFLLHYRTETQQSVKWGGDPRKRSVFAEEQDLTPSHSFSLWVERVKGQCLPWSAHQRALLQRSLELICAQLEVSGNELGVLLRTGMRRAIRNREMQQERTRMVIDSIRSGVAMALMSRGETVPCVVAMNALAHNTFSIDLNEHGLTLAEFEQISGIDLPWDGEAQSTATFVSPTDGLRECEIYTSLLFEAFDGAGDEPILRVQAYEFRDVTEAKRLEDALLAARERAERDLMVRTEYFNKLSHELKTPLNALVGLSTLLLKRGELAEGKPRLWAENINLAANHMNEIVQSTLDNALNVQVAGTETFQQVSLHDCMDEVVRLLDVVARDKEITLSVGSDVDVTIRSDVRAVRQILLNLVTNSIKYNRRGGFVRLSVAFEDSNPVVLVEDDGDGMTPEQLARCTVPYERFGQNAGTGLGLSVANHLAMAIGAQLALESSPGLGTTARVIFADAIRNIAS